MKNYNNKANQRGIALISVALFTMVMGVLMFSAVYVLKTQSAAKSEQKNIDHSITVQEAIENYVAINGRYPCPAPMNAVPDTATFGVEARNAGGCNGAALSAGPIPTGSDGSTPVFIGSVPIRTLSIPENMIADGNRQRYVYAISGNMVQATGNIRYDQGVISINDSAGNSLTTPADMAVYALVSPGADTRGATDISGVASAQGCPTATDNADTNENCDGDAVFVSKSEKVAGNTVADYTASVAFAANPTAFNWSADPWGSCVPRTARRCYDGTQSRAVNCLDRSGNPAPSAASCAHTPQPAATRNCDLGPCRWGAPSCSVTPDEVVTCEPTRRREHDTWRWGCETNRPVDQGYRFRYEPYRGLKNVVLSASRWRIRDENCNISYTEWEYERPGQCRRSARTYSVEAHIRIAVAAGDRNDIDQNLADELNNAENNATIEASQKLSEALTRAHENIENGADEEESIAELEEDLANVFQDAETEFNESLSAEDRALYEDEIERVTDDLSDRFTSQAREIYNELRDTGSVNISEISR